MRSMLFVAAVATLATPALASERTGYQAIAAGQLSQAETTIERERAIFRDRPELLLNLAAVYARTDRSDAARALYQRVLDQDAVAFDLADGSSADSHAIARRGMSRLGVVLTAR